MYHFLFIFVFVRLSSVSVAARARPRERPFRSCTTFSSSRTSSLPSSATQTVPSQCLANAVTCQDSTSTRPSRKQARNRKFVMQTAALSRSPTRLCPHRALLISARSSELSGATRRFRRSSWSSRLATRWYVVVVFLKKKIILLFISSAALDRPVSDGDESVGRKMSSRKKVSVTKNSRKTEAIFSSLVPKRPATQPPMRPQTRPPR